MLALPERIEQRSAPQRRHGRVSLRPQLPQGTPPAVCRRQVPPRPEPLLPRSRRSPAGETVRHDLRLLNHVAGVSHVTMTDSGDKPNTRRVDGADTAPRLPGAQPPRRSWRRSAGLMAYPSPLVFKLHRT